MTSSLLVCLFACLFVVTLCLDVGFCATRCSTMVTTDVLCVELASKDDSNPAWSLRISSMRLSALCKTNFFPKPTSELNHGLWRSDWGGRGIDSHPWGRHCWSSERGGWGKTQGELKKMLLELKLIPQELSIKILPLTEGEQEKQYVSLNLVVSLPEGSTNNVQITTFVSCTLLMYFQVLYQSSVLF